MNHLQDPLLVLAGVGAGLAASIAGLTSLVSYPALLLTGLSPATAKVTNTVAIVFGSVGSVSSSRAELVGQRRQVLLFSAIGIAGGVCGGVLLLVTPAAAFGRIVPWLIGLASLTILLIKRPVAMPVEEDRPSILVLIGVFAVGVYGGLFRAAAVLLLALLLATTSDTLPRCSALKNVVVGLANAAAGIFFVVSSHIAWLSVLFLGADLFVGGRLGPVTVRFLPVRLQRTAIALAGVGLALYLELDSR